MPFDMLAMAAVVDELQAGLTGGRIQKIVQPSSTSIGLAIYAGRLHWLVLSAHARYARIQLARERLAKAFPVPSPFIMLLRKHLEDARIVAIEQVMGERIAHLSCSSGSGIRTLVLEAMGKHSNIILLDEDETVLGALKLVAPRQSRVRPILPGRRYAAPPRRSRDEAILPPGPRIMPVAGGQELLAILAMADRNAPLKAALLGSLEGASPFLAEQIARKASCDPESALSAAPLQAVAEAAFGLYAPLRSGAWSPCTFRPKTDHCDFAPYRVEGFPDVTPCASMNDAVDRCWETLESHDALAAARQELIAELMKKLQAQERKLASLEQGLAAAGDADAIREQGELILAYKFALAPASDELTIDDLGRTIPLDPRRTPQENAERLFRRYHKLREAQRRLPTMIEQARQEKDRLEDILVFARLARTEGDLRALRTEIRPEANAATGRKPSPRRGPARFLRDGVEALVGRNARENEELTFRLAQRNDLWLHARQRTGAHVVLRGNTVDDDAIRAAAGLAAYFSEGRSDSAVDVDVTEVRNVRKIPGGPTGRVTYSRHRTLHVAPSAEGWEPGG